jgi:hypothetical protein
MLKISPKIEIQINTSHNNNCENKIRFVDRSVQFIYIIIYTLYKPCTVIRSICEYHINVNGAQSPQQYIIHTHIYICVVSIIFSGSFCLAYKYRYARHRHHEYSAQT